MTREAVTLAVVGDLHWQVGQRPTYHHHFKDRKSVV